VVKVPHHGSSTSSSAAFVARTGAGHAVVSVGARNRFGHPDARVIDHWSRAGSRVWRTDEWGAVVAILDSAGVRVNGTSGQ
jgi:competence protein ComEC